MDHERASPRSRTFLKGVISFGQTTAACTIRDLSPDGARIEISEAISLPSDIELFIPQRNQRLPALLRWRDGELVGLQFPTGSADLVEEIIPPKAAERIEKLEAEVKRLRLILDQIRDDPGRIQLLLNA